MVKRNEKYNDSSVKLFEFLKLLSSGEADYKDVIDLFSDESVDGKSNPHVVLNKYLNTLKIFGIKVKKDNNKYYMLSSPSQIDLSSEDLKAINLLKEALALLPNGKTKSNFENFLRALEIRYSENTQGLAQYVNNSSKVSLSFYFSELSEQIKQCEKYCQDQQKLDINYVGRKNKDEHIVCSPLELKYHKRKICLCVYGQVGSQIFEIPIENIKSIEQLPTITTSKKLTTTVVFKLKNKLAKNYKLREWESSNGYNDEGHLVVVNKNEDFDVLVTRLMRYGSECTIVSPKYIKDKMIELINDTLSLYDEG